MMMMSFFFVFFPSGVFSFRFFAATLANEALHTRRQFAQNLFDVSVQKRCGLLERVINLLLVHMVDLGNGERNHDKRDGQRDRVEPEAETVDGIEASKRNRR